MFNASNYFLAEISLFLATVYADLSWCFVSPFSWSADTLWRYTKYFSNKSKNKKKQWNMERRTLRSFSLYKCRYMIYRVFLSGSFVCCNFMHHLFWKVFCNILIQKFKNYTPWTGNTLYVYAFILEQLSVPEILIFLFLRPVKNTHFPDHLQAATFQIISWSSRNIMRLDIHTNVIHNLTQDIAYFQ